MSKILVTGDGLYARVGGGDWYAIPKAMEAAFRAGGAEICNGRQIVTGTTESVGIERSSQARGLVADVA